ncbi:MAG: SDR family oxidoreductase [Ectothiorhodospiraceae bacterium]|nr:SDR family oxidoreductase [Ectothiorhodospiraceae bacterium]
MEHRFAGRVLLLTGAAASRRDRQMGFAGATAWRFLAEGGAGVVLTDVADEPGEASAEQMRDAGHAALYHHLDVTDERQWSAVVGATLERFGRLDYLVNIAGIIDREGLLDVSPDHWRHTMEVSTLGVFLGTRAVAEPMSSGGGGAIVYLASMAAHRGAAGYGSAYAFSRSGMLNFARSAALQLADRAIRVNVVSPGWVRTPFTEALHADPVQRDYRSARVPLARWGEPREIAAGVLFLLSDDASYVTGSELLIDGGVCAGERRPPIASQS